MALNDVRIHKHQIVLARNHPRMQWLFPGWIPVNQARDERIDPANAIQRHPISRSFSIHLWPFIRVLIVSRRASLAFKKHRSFLASFTRRHAILIWKKQESLVDAWHRRFRLISKGSARVWFESGVEWMSSLELIPKTDWYRIRTGSWVECFKSSV